MSAIFNRVQKCVQRTRALQYPVKQATYLKAEIGARLQDRFADITREFTATLDVDAGRGFLSQRPITLLDTVHHAEDAIVKRMHNTKENTALENNTALKNNTASEYKDMIKEDAIVERVHNTKENNALENNTASEYKDMIKEDAIVERVHNTKENNALENNTASEYKDMIKEDAIVKRVHNTKESTALENNTALKNNTALENAERLKEDPIVKRVHNTTENTASDHRDMVKEDDIVKRVLRATDTEMLGFADGSFDCVTTQQLHWTNDLPLFFGETVRVLQPDGVFLGCMLGGDTLFELRTCLQLAETDLRGGIGAHVSPMVRLADVSGLMAAAGLNLVTIDTEEICVRFPSMFHLLHDLRAWGETSCLDNQATLSRDVLVAADAIYREVYGKNVDGVSSINATFQLIYMIGWKPSAANPHPKPLMRGSAKTSLKDVL